MIKVLLGLSIVFAILTICGAGYVLHTGGTANAGYACVPMTAALAFFSLYRKKRDTK